MEYLCAVYCLFQGEGTEGIGEREILVATLNYVTGSSIIGKITSRSQTGQLALLTRVATNCEPFSLSLRESPAQNGQLRLSPALLPGGSSISCPQSGHLTVFIVYSPSNR